MTSLVDNQIKAAEKEWLDLWEQGPSRLRWTKVPLQVGDLAPDFECARHIRKIGSFTRFLEQWSSPNFVLAALRL